VEGKKEVQTQIQEQQLQVDTIAAFRFHGIIKNSDDTGSKVYNV
jgi:hypothetical protein